MSNARSKSRPRQRDSFLDRLAQATSLLSPAGWCWIALLLLPLIGAADYFTGYEIAFSLFYLLPISIVAWNCRRRAATLIAIASALTWLLADLADRPLLLDPVVHAWNTLVRLTFFLIVSSLLFLLREAVIRARDMARTDFLTGVVNTRFFYDLADREVARLRRYGSAFTLAYLDLDHFKAVNDRFGHHIGDKVLCTIAESAKAHLRCTDIVARLGGDEFAILLPETGVESARVAVGKLLSQLQAEMRQYNWPVTLSVGVLTCLAAPPSTDELVRRADRLMYEVKQNDKNGARYGVYGAPATGGPHA